MKHSISSRLSVVHHYRVSPHTKYGVRIRDSCKTVSQWINDTQAAKRSILCEERPIDFELEWIHDTQDIGSFMNKESF